MDNSELNLSTGWVWPVFRRDDTKDPVEWHIQGIAADEQLAIEMCVDETYLIGPVPFNATLQHDPIAWVGSYYPCKEKKC